MANPDLAAALATFEARIHRSKNRLVSVPAKVQRQLGLESRQNNHLVLVSMRRAKRGRWNHHYLKLTRANEFGIPADVRGIGPGDLIEVRIHKVIPDQPALHDSLKASGAGLLLALSDRPREGWRQDGSEKVDAYLREEIARSPGAS